MKIKSCSGYIIRNRDPVLDLMNTVYERSDLTPHQLAKKGGASASTTVNQRKGKTRFPTHKTIAANASIMGYDFVLMERSTGKIIKRKMNGHKRH